VYPVEVTLLDSNGNGEATIIAAARTCYDSGDKSTPESDDRLIANLIKNGHHAMLEFGWAAFRVRCSRVVSHELVRMRLCSFAQRSQRYVNESDPDYAIPPDILDGPYSDYAYGMYEQAMKLAYDTYSSLLESKVPKQIARYVLPNACMTELIVGANFREWRHVCVLRTSRQAQPEMRILATKILSELKQLAPRVFADIPLPTDIAS
jgi:thymidylate synthase (FAD)